MWYYSVKDKFDKFIHTAEITKNRLLNKTNGIDSILAKRIVKNKQSNHYKLKNHY